MTKLLAIETRERPIIFSAPMVREILDGNKTQTRRVCKDRHGACPFGSVLDRLWVRETWGQRGRRFGPPSVRQFVYYRATEVKPEIISGWRPSIHMPRWASRITLEIAGLRVERLQDISEEDAEAEGVVVDHYYCDEGEGESGHRCDPVRRFAELWDQLNYKRGYGWNKNPWVWVIEFRRLEP